MRINTETRASIKTIVCIALLALIVGIPLSIGMWEVEAWRGRAVQRVAAMQDKRPVPGPYLTPKDQTLDPGQKLVDAPPVLMSLGTGMYSAVTIRTRAMRQGEQAETYTIYTVDADGNRTPPWHIIETPPLEQGP